MVIEEAAKDMCQPISITKYLAELRQRMLLRTLTGNDTCGGTFQPQHI